MKRIKIFISSVQSEFTEERAMLCHYIRTDVLLGKFFEPFIFEEFPANEYPTSHVYLKEVEMCDIYLGLYGNLYGYENKEGISPTEQEYDLAASLHKSRLIYIKSIGEEKRHPKESVFIRKVERDIVRKTFVDIDGLRTSVYASLIRYLEEKEYIRWRPFDASCDNGATLNDLDEDKMRNFIHMARSKRNFPLSVETSPEILLTHLDFCQEEDFKVIIWRAIEGQDVPKVIQSVPNDDPKVIQNVLSNELKLIALIIENPSISRAELAKQLNLSERQIRKIIDRLRNNGKLKREGGKIGKWIIIEE